ncbi:hypothetical protein FRC00_012959 [Tulasnella sp. 408]|nr:hypothetical protein FRC00_012959 [Tulasnella sp. 408]
MIPLERLLDDVGAEDEEPVVEQLPVDPPVSVRATNGVGSLPEMGPHIRLQFHDGFEKSGVGKRGICFDAVPESEVGRELPPEWERDGGTGHAEEDAVLNGLLNGDAEEGVGTSERERSAVGVGAPERGWCVG